MRVRAWRWRIKDGGGVKCESKRHVPKCHWPSCRARRYWTDHPLASIPFDLAMIKICISKTRTRFVSKKGGKGAKEGNGFALMRMPDMITSLFASRQIEELHRRLAASQASTLIVVVRLREADSRWSASSSLQPVQRPALLLKVEGSTDWDPGLPSLATGMSLTCLEAVKRGGS